MPRPRRALELITNGARVGLGSGRTASVFVRLLGERVRAGLRVTAVPASGAIDDAGARRRESRWYRCPRTSVLDITVDGADEVAPNLDLIKGHGGALVRERIVARASGRQVILVGADKLVRELGARFPVPVEVIPFALGPVIRAIQAAGLVPNVRMDAEGMHELVNENGNLTVDCALPAPLADAHAARDARSADARDRRRGGYRTLPRDRGTRACRPRRRAGEHARPRKATGVSRRSAGTSRFFHRALRSRPRPPERFIAAAAAAIAATGTFSVALSGGSTPHALFTLLASPPYARRVEWPRVQLFWGDERCVPPGDEESNYRIAREAAARSRAAAPGERPSNSRRGCAPAAAKQVRDGSCVRPSVRRRARRSARRARASTWCCSASATTVTRRRSSRTCSPCTNRRAG